MIWLVSLVELRVCFSWGSGFGEVSSWVNRSSQAESQLKQKSCLLGCVSSKLEFWLIVDVLPGRMSWLDVEVELRRYVVVGGRVFLVGLRSCFSLVSACRRPESACWVWNPS